MAGVQLDRMSVEEWVNRQAWTDAAKRLYRITVNAVLTSEMYQ